MEFQEDIVLRDTVLFALSKFPDCRIIDFVVSLSKRKIWEGRQ